MRILAIDPGYDRVGIAVLEGDASTPILIHSGCLVTNRKESQSLRLAEIAKNVQRLISEHKPDILAIEVLYFSVNQKTAIGVAEARGAIIAEAGRAKITVSEIHPNSVKVAVTGYGATKKQGVMDMVKRIMKIKKTIKYDDEYDAIAIGITTLATLKTKFRQ